jgi:hypothetical protein
MKGSYSNADGGFVHSGIRALLGCPVFGYNSEDQTNYSSVWRFLKAADDLNYILGAGTDGVTDINTNQCGIATGHAYSVISLFYMNGLQMIMLRNPWGYTRYAGDWDHNYSNWTTENKALVPFGVDPTTSHEKGIFFLQDKDFLRCLNDF